MVAVPLLAPFITAVLSLTLPDTTATDWFDDDHCHFDGAVNTIFPVESFAMDVSVVCCPIVREDVTAVTATLVTVLAMVMLAVAGVVEEIVTVWEPVACVTPLPSALGCAEAVKTTVVAGRLVRVTLEVV